VDLADHHHRSAIVSSKQGGSSTRPFRSWVYSDKGQVDDLPYFFGILDVMLFRILILLFGGLVAGRAELKWASTEVLLPLDSGQTEGRATFAFTNTGSSSVTFVSIKPGCGCTSYHLDPATVAPGQAGKLEAIFSVGERRGSFHVPIDVTTTASSEPIQLSLIAHIRELVKIVPPYLQWKAGEARQPRRVELYWDDATAVKLEAVISSDESFQAVVQPAPEWTGAILTITPPERANAFSIITVKTQQGKNARERAYTIVVRTF